MKKLQEKMGPANKSGFGAGVDQDWEEKACVRRGI